MKRRDESSNHISREEYENQEDDDGEVAGTFHRADASVLATRKIIKTKRPSSVMSTDGGPSLPIPVAPVSSNPFAGISIIKKPTEETKAPVFGIQSSIASIPSTTTTSDASSKMRKLNRTFLSWLETQGQTNPLSIWKEGVKVQCDLYVLFIALYYP